MHITTSKIYVGLLN